MQKHILTIACLGISGLCMALFLSNCAPEPRFRTPALGEIVSIPPIAVNKLLGPQAVRTGGLKLNIMWGGRAMTSDKGDPTLNFYSPDGTLKFSYKWAQLETAYHDTGCSSEQVRSLDGYLRGAALICDGSLKLEGVARIEGVEDKGEKRSATSWSVYQADDDVTSVSIGLY